MIDIVPDGKECKHILRQMTESEFDDLFKEVITGEKAYCVLVEKAKSNGWIKEEKKKVKRWMWAKRPIWEKEKNWGIFYSLYSEKEAETLKYDCGDINGIELYEICKIPGSEIEVEE